MGSYRRYIPHEVRSVSKRDIPRSGEFTPTYIPKFTTPEEFADKKIMILREHLRIPITDEDAAYIHQYKTEYEITNAVKTIINKYWE